MSATLPSAPLRPAGSRRGIDLLSDAALNKGTAFTERERRKLGLQGLLPPRVDSIEEQMLRVMENYGNKPNDLERFIYLTALYDRNETLFYRVLIEHVEEMMPIVYTPTVGRACQLYGHIWRRPRGLYVSALDAGSVEEVLANWPGDDVRVIVITDGERILGLGDLGAGGMGIPIGKLTLYSACAGVDPGQTLPVMLDVGTDNEELLRDPLYLGIRRRRLRGEEYDRLVDEFVVAAQKRWPGVLIQWEDFANANSFRLLERYRDRVCSFNDDIQGTAAVTLAGLLSALRITRRPLEEQRILFLGAGSAGIGIADLMASAMRDRGLSAEEARSRFWFVDSKGLVVKSRTDLAPHKLGYAHDLEPLPDLLHAVQRHRPTVLIGASGRANSFGRPVLEAMAAQHERPIVFALSNPTSKAECTPEEAYDWSDGRAIYASGSPFPPVKLDGRTIVPGQGNNAYIFPGVGLAVIATRARRVTDSMLAAAAQALARQVSEEDLARGCIFPPMPRIRESSAAVALAVAREAYRLGLAEEPEPEDLEDFLRARTYWPEYRDSA